MSNATVIQFKLNIIVSIVADQFLATLLLCELKLLIGVC